MKIEKINDNQIKCTLNKSDLITHKLKISELAYGTDNAKELFRDMMEEAAERFGFEANDIPLMIEAIPISPDCIVLLITKVSNPEELEKKMSKFSPATDSINGDLDDNSDDNFDDLDEFFPVLDSFQEKKDDATRLEKKKDGDTTLDRVVISDLLSTLVYSFGSLGNVIKVSNLLDITGIEDTSLYHAPNNRYYLVIHLDNVKTQVTDSLKATLDEFGTNHVSDKAVDAYYKEYYKLIIEEDVFGKLAN